VRVGGEQVSASALPRFLVSVIMFASEGNAIGERVWFVREVAVLKSRLLPSYRWSVSVIETISILF